MSKKKESDLLSLQTEFVTRSIEKGYKKELAEKVYELILKFANYGFNKAHSVAYSLLGYKMAYLKAHFPAQFMSSLLTNVIGNKTKIKEYIDECRLNNLEILKPNVNKSSAQFTLVDNKIIFSLAAISNVGFLTANKIVETRKSGDYSDYFDFISRTYGNSVNRKVIESLILSGALDSFNYNRKTMIENIDNAINYAEIVKGSSLLEVEKPVMINYEEYPDKDLCLKEKEAFGFYFNNHPVSFYKAQGSYLDLDKIEKYFDKVIEVVVYVERIKKIKTKNNEEMAFITASDETGTIDLVLFPKVYSLYELKINSLIKVKARVEKRLSRYQLSVLKMENLSDI
jgi:DNA polymerase-3 subunit alpha